MLQIHEPYPYGFEGSTDPVTAAVPIKINSLMKADRDSSTIIITDLSKKTFKAERFSDKTWNILGSQNSLLSSPKSHLLLQNLIYIYFYIFFFLIHEIISKLPILTRIII